MRVLELNHGQVAILDDEDFEYLAQWRWYFHKATGYAVRTEYLGGGAKHRKYRHIKMHLVILPKKEGFFTDHENRNRLDNRRCNLRHATRAQNNSNSGIRKDSETQLKGVSLRKDKKTKPYQAHITKDKKQIHLGSFTTPEEAAMAYNAAAIRLHGEFANIN